MHHLRAQQAAAYFAAHAQARTHRQCFLLRRIKVQKAQLQFAGAIHHAHDQLVALALLHVAVRDHALHLHDVAVAHFADRREACFVFVAQRQVQGEVDVAHQTHLLQGALRGGQSGVHAQGIGLPGNAINGRYTTQQTSSRYSAALQATSAESYAGPAGARAARLCRALYHRQFRRNDARQMPRLPAAWACEPAQSPLPCQLPHHRLPCN